MPFVKKAKRFLKYPGKLASNKYLRHMKATIKFLLNDHIGYQNRVAIDKIIDYLERKRLDINMSQWQIEVLGPLRDNGIYIGSVPSKGMFIISNEEDAQRVVRAIERRIKKETKRCKILKKIIRNVGWSIR